MEQEPSFGESGTKTTVNYWQLKKNRTRNMITY
jgi:hypothetical protein